MRKLILISVACTTISLTHSQHSGPVVANLKMLEEDREFIVTYDLVNYHEDSSYRVDFYVIDNIGTIVYPDSITGDFGNSIEGGRGKTIVWDIFAEYDVVHGTFTPHIIVNGHEGYSIRKGPAWGLLSVPVPGLAGYFVADKREMIFKPCLRTAASLGLVALGMTAGARREYIEPVWSQGAYADAWYFNGSNWVFGPTYIEPHIIEGGHHDYWLFKNDKEILISAGAAVWLYDIFWSIVQGRKNNQLKRSLRKKYSIGIQGDELRFSYVLTF